MWTNETLFKVLYGNVGRKVFKKKDKVNDPSSYNRVVSYSSFVKVWGYKAASGDTNLHFARDSIIAQDYTYS